MNLVIKKNYYAAGIFAEIRNVRVIDFWKIAFLEETILLQKLEHNFQKKKNNKQQKRESRERFGLHIR